VVTEWALYRIRQPPSTRFHLFLSPPTSPSASATASRKAKGTLNFLCLFFNFPPNNSSKVARFFPCSSQPHGRSTRLWPTKPFWAPSQSLQPAAGRLPSRTWPLPRNCLCKLKPGPSSYLRPVPQLRRLLFVSRIPGGLPISHLGPFFFFTAQGHDSDSDHLYNRQYSTSVDSHLSGISASQHGPFTDIPGSSAPYPAWSSERQIPISMEEIEDIFLDLTYKFGFQKDSMRNMVSHHASPPSLLLTLDSLPLVRFLDASIRLPRLPHVS
jgi:hypothetical protein